eukprot:GFYU01002131.1.p1 GENE.GFYU01002131.1~~GFYU01002131.1.p1  ORF type:complete len:230 (+),score=45.08 GFYU01002131.1:443-1132(+)
MKYLDITQLDEMNTALANLDAGDQTLHGKVEAYSCKRAAEDKKLAKELEDQLTEAIASSPVVATSLSKSPMGDFMDQSVRKIFINLISTLNASFSPDYDFRDTQPSDFVMEPDLNQTFFRIRNAIKVPTFDVDKLFAVMNETINLWECEVYSYSPDMDEHPFSDEGMLWCLTYFFYNRKQKKLLFFNVFSVSKMRSFDSEHIVAPTSMAEEGNFEMDDFDMEDDNGMVY